MGKQDMEGETQCQPPYTGCIFLFFFPLDFSFASSHLSVAFFIFSSIFLLYI